MRYEDQVAESLPQSSALRKGILREECLKFSLAHANQFDQLLIFLDELSDISRFRTLALNLQSCLLIHLAGLMNVFSNSRVEKLFNDMKNYLFSSYSNQLQYNYEKHLLCISCWKGLYQCLEEASLSSLECISHIEKFIEVLFIMLPTSRSGTDAEVDEVHSTKEWSEAIRCLGKARQAWLLNFLQVHDSISSYFQGLLHCSRCRDLYSNLCDDHLSMLEKPLQNVFLRSNKMGFLIYWKPYIFICAFNLAFLTSQVPCAGLIRGSCIKR